MRLAQPVRVLVLILLALLVLAPRSPAAAQIAATPSAVTKDYLPTPRTLMAAPSNLQIAAIAIGAAAGAIVGNLLTGGLMAPILTGGLAVAAVAPGGAYVGGLLGTVVGTALGAYAGRLLSMRAPGNQNQ